MSIRMGMMLQRRETVGQALRRVLAECDLPPEAAEVLTLWQLAVIRSHVRKAAPSVAPEKGRAA